MELLKGKVVKILDGYTVLIDIGLDKNAKEGMKFVIYEEGDLLFHPETGLELGRYEKVKAKVQIIHVQEKVSHARTYKILTYSTNPFPTNIFSRTEREQLPLGDEQVKTFKDKDKPLVNVGDLVRQIPDS